MFEEDKTPRVIIRLQGDGLELQHLRGKLIHEAGVPFAVADEGAIGSLPENAKVQLDASLLEEQPDNGEGFPLYLYRGVLVRRQ